MPDVPTARLGIAIHECLSVPKPIAIRDERREADLMAQRVTGSRPVDEDRREVHERIAERRHLPVKNRAYARIDGVDDAVVEPVIAVHDRPRGTGRDRRHALVEPGRQRLDLGQVAGFRQLPLLAPTTHLPRQETLGLAEVTETHCCRVHRVQFGERVHELGGQHAGILGAQSLGGRVARQDAARHVFHDEESRAVDALVVAEGQRLRGPEPSAGNAPEHGELAAHVMRGRHDVAERRAPDDQRGFALRHEVGDIRQPAGQSRRLDIANADQPALAQPRHDRVEIQALGGRHAPTVLRRRGEP